MNSPPKISALSALLAAFILFLLLQPAAAWAQVEELDLDEPGVNQAVPPALAPADLDLLRQRLDEAAAIFASADQLSALPLLAQVIDPLEALAAGGRLADPARELLTSALAYRLQILFNQGEDTETQAALERLLELDAGFELDPAQVSPKLLTQFQKLRGKRVGDVGLVLDPEDAAVSVDGRPIADAGSRPLALLEGRHELWIHRPGYEEQRRELEVQAGKVLTLDIQLPRKSIVLRLQVKPREAAVFIDGKPFGETSGSAGEGFLSEGNETYRKEDFSAEMVIEGIEPGLRLLEVRKPGFRPYRAELPLGELIDYPMPPIVLEPESGIFNFNDCPQGAVITINGEVKTPDIAGTSRPQITMPPGEYDVMVSLGPTRMFATHLLLSDRQTVEVNVKLRPGFALLGVLGGDRTGVESLRLTLRQALAEGGRFTLIEPSQAIDLPGISVDSLRREAGNEEAGRRDEIDWKAVQARSAKVPALLYAIAVLSNDLVASDATIWVWAASPGPARPDRLSVRVGESSEAERLREIFERRILLSRPSFGALVVDSSAAPHPVVIDVTPESPAALAGVQPGDLILGVASVLVQSRAQLEARLGAAEVGETIDLAVQSVGNAENAAGARNLQLKVGSSPNLIGERGDDNVLPALAYTQLLLQEEKTPPQDLWVVQANEAFLLLRAGDIEGGVRKLRGVRAPQVSHGVGQATIDYALALALLRLGDDETYLSAARSALERVAQAPGARLGYNDGPYLQPRARARLEELPPGP